LGDRKRFVHEKKREVTLLGMLRGDIVLRNGFILVTDFGEITDFSAL
jgi:hypothetical protein